MIKSIENNLFVGNIDIYALVEKYGHPLYVYDLEVIKSKYDLLRTAFPAQVEVFYSVKANPNISVIAAVAEFVQGIEIASLAEMKAARQAGVASERIIFVGPSKSEEELAEAITEDIFCIVAESERELLLINEIAGRRKKKVRLAVRLNPDFETVGSKLLMGGKASQFGMDEESFGTIFELIKKLENIRLVGLHVYVGTQTLDYRAISRNVASIIEIGERLQNDYKIDLEFIDFGGGIGVPYYDDEEEVRFDLLARSLREVFSAFNKKFPKIRLFLESGRFLLAESGLYITQVRDIKRSKNKTFVLVSGGINHNHTALAFSPENRPNSLIKIAKRNSAALNVEIDICGPLCTPNDLLGKSVILPEPEIGDLIAVLKSGAYGFTASIINFLSHPHPAEVLVYKGESFLIRQTTTAEDLLRNQILAFKSEAL